MNCHEAKNLLFADRESALESQRAALDQHVTQCGSCRRIRDDLAAAFTTWRRETADGPLPDVEREWYAVRRKIRGGAEAGSTAAERPRRLFPWLAIPLGAAAALAVTLSLVIEPSGSKRTPTPPHPATLVARADSVEVPGDASTMVYVDDKSGWLVVWASDAKQI